MGHALEISIGFLGAIVARATVLTLVALALALVLRRRSAALRHQLWSGTIVLVLLLPLAGGLLPPLMLALVDAARSGPPPVRLVPPPASAPVVLLPPPWAPVAPDEPSLVSARSRPTVDPAPRAPTAPRRWWPLALATAWLLGAALVLGRSVRARRVAERWRVATTAADPKVWPATPGIAVREGEHIELPMTIGALWPVVLVPAVEGRRWSPAWRAAVLAHEAAHVRRGDPLLQALAELACALYWFHPLVWLAARQLRTERELAADDDVLRGGVPPGEYVELLIALGSLPVNPPRTGAVLPMLTPAGLKARLLGIIDDVRRRGMGRGSRLALGLAGLGLFVPTASAVLVPEGPPAIGPGTVLACARDWQTHRPIAGAEVDVWDGTMLADRVSTGGDGCVRWLREGPRTDQFIAYVRRGAMAGRRGITTGKYGTPLPATIDMRPARAISGIIRDDQGHPLAGAIARVVGSQTWAQGPGPDAADTSDAGGHFRLEGLLYGEYRLLFESRSGGFTTVRVRLDEQDVSDVEAIVPAATPVSGYLRDEGGAPVAGARIEELPGPRRESGRRLRGRHLDWDVSAADGSFRLVVLGRTVRATGRDRAGGLVMVSFPDGDRRPSPLQPGAWDGGRPISPPTIVLRPAGMVRGTIRYDDGRPAPGVGVAGFLRRDPRHVILLENMAESRTDDQGRFWLGPFPYGTVDLVAVAPPISLFSTKPLGVNAQVAVTGNRSPHIEFLLLPNWGRAQFLP